MKKLLLAIAVITAVSFTSNAQDKKFAVKVNPLSLGFATVNVQLEKTISSSSSIQLGTAVSSLKVLGTKYNFFQLTPEFRKYFGEDNAMKGWYVGPYLRLLSGKYDSGFNVDVKYTTFGGGAVIGYEKASSKGFVFDVFAGPNYGATSFKGSASINGESASGRGTGNGFGLRVGLAIGFAK